MLRLPARQAVFVLGEMLLALLAYFIPDWKRLSLTCAGITAAYLISFVAAKESPRWLAMRVRVLVFSKEVRGGGGRSSGIQGGSQCGK